jgi:hypothetical protein
LKSRFTDFLTTDGEKSWRDRDSEFVPRLNIARAELMAVWDEGWKILFAALQPLGDSDLSSRAVTIRGETFLIFEALHRLLAHTTYHVGQIVYLAKAFRGSEWDCLTIPGEIEQYNRSHSRKTAELFEGRDLERFHRRTGLQHRPFHAKATRRRSNTRRRRQDAGTLAATSDNPDHCAFGAGFADSLGIIAAKTPYRCPLARSPSPPVRGRWLDRQRQSAGQYGV